MMMLTLMTCRGGLVTVTVATSCLRRGRRGGETGGRRETLLTALLLLRSGPTFQYHHDQDTDRDPVIAELSDQEIMEALNIIEKVRKNQEDTEVLTDEEVKAV